MRFFKWGLIAVLLILLLPAAACHRNDAAGEPFLAENDSWFDDFQIIGESVVVSCHLTIESPGDADVTVEIYGDFSEDAESGLVKESVIKAVSLDDCDVSRLIIPPGRTQLDVVFMGTHGSSEKKQDRLLPEIEILVVNPD